MRSRFYEEVREPNQWLEPLAVATRTVDLMKQFSVFATLTPASGGSAFSR
jgi:TonB family protein